MPRNPDDTLTAGPAPRLPLADAAPRTAEVLLPAALPLRLTYGVPDGMDLQPGDWVDVPLGPRSITGVVWADIATAPTDFDPARLKSITHRHDAIPLPDTMRQFVDWIADYTLCEPGAVLKMVLRNPDLLIPERPRPALRYTGQPPERMTSARERVMELIADGFVWIKGDLARAAGVSTSVIGGLVSSSTLETVLVPPGPPPKPEPDHAAPTLTADQQTAAETLVAPVRTDTFAVTLLDGVTGSGKTEVYFEAIAETLRMGRQALVLLPEIALTGQFLERFEQRFG
ncbi:MAG: DEAD/DEAH box helicase, partial [Pseudomonadota bacterium]